MRCEVAGAVHATALDSHLEQFRNIHDAQPARQPHDAAIYTFRPALRIAGDGNFWTGGRVTTAGVEAARPHVPISYSAGAFTTIGGDYWSLGASCSYAWAAGKKPSPPK